MNQGGFGYIKPGSHCLQGIVVEGANEILRHEQPGCKFICLQFIQPLLPAVLPSLRDEQMFQNYMPYFMSCGKVQPSVGRLLVWISVSLIVKPYLIDSVKNYIGYSIQTLLRIPPPILSIEYCFRFSLPCNTLMQSKGHLLMLFVLTNSFSFDQYLDRWNDCRAGCIGIHDLPLICSAGTWHRLDGSHILGMALRHTIGNIISHCRFLAFPLLFHDIRKPAVIVLENMFGVARHIPPDSLPSSSRFQEVFRCGAIVSTRPVTAFSCLLIDGQSALLKPEFRQFPLADASFLS